MIPYNDNHQFVMSDTQLSSLIERLARQEERMSDMRAAMTSMSDTLRQIAGAVTDMRVLQEQVIHVRRDVSALDSDLDLVTTELNKLRVADATNRAERRLWQLVNGGAGALIMYLLSILADKLL